MSVQTTNKDDQLALFGAIINFSDDAIISKSLDGTIISWNPAAEQMFGYGAHEAIGQHISLIIPQHLANEEHDIIGKIKAGNNVRHYETQRVRKDGTLIDISLTVSPLKDAAGNIIGASKIARDITRRKLTDTHLDKTLRELADYKYALDESSIVAITDQKGIINYVNDNFCKISGYSPVELIGQDHRIINSGYHSKAFIRELWTTIANGHIWRGELRNKAKNGNLYWVHTTIVPFINDDKKPYRYVAIRYDITERKLAEEKLLKSEKIYRTIALNLPGTVIVIMDTDNKYLLAEGEGLSALGLTKEGMESNTEKLQVDEGIHARIIDNRKKAFLGEQVSDEIEYKNKVFRIQYLPLRDEDDHIYAIMIISLDITDIRQASLEIEHANASLELKVKERTEQLQLANKELEAFSYSVSHDLRAPLRIINGYADILAKDNRENLDDDSKNSIDIIMSNTRKMGKLIDDLLTLARMGRKEMILQDIDMGALVADVLEEQTLLARKPFSINVHALLNVSCDRSLIRHVWSNLIGNAIKYSARRDDPAIDISSSIQEGKVIYMIRDNGVGFDMAYSDKLFGVFQRLHKLSEFEGTGVGLALAQRIIARHGGTIWAASEVNKGATFFFSLPL